MRRRPPRASRVLLLLSLAVGAATTLALRAYLLRLEAAAEAGGARTNVVVAATDLPRGTVLAPGMLRAAPVPEEWLPPGALRDAGWALGRTLAADVLAGEVVTEARLAPEGGPVAALIPPGLRAVTVTAPLPAGAVVSGDRVDVLATYPRRPHTETVVAGAEVLTVLGSAAAEDLGSVASVLLLVSPETAERLAFARAFADLSLAVAPPGPSAPFGEHP